MVEKIFVNSSIATKGWMRFAKASFWMLLFTILIPVVLFTGILWIVSLGHITLVRAIWGWMERIAETKLP